MKQEAIRMIYSNYNFINKQKEGAVNFLAVNGNIKPTDKDIWEEVCQREREDWVDARFMLNEFFAGHMWIAKGQVSKGGECKDYSCIITSFKDLLNKVANGRVMLQVYDINGHLFLKSIGAKQSGTVEIRRMSDKGVLYFNKWKNRNRGVCPAHNMREVIWYAYTLLPNYAYIVNGCPQNAV